MIVRIKGGNSGIAEYLETGIKADRSLLRDKLDQRVVLFGDLQVSDKVIDSIENKGQERYLHITLSFDESDLSNDVLSNVLKEYKSLLMSAYHDDEYSFYAEAHLPKIKHVIDDSTGQLVERKPHIHVVIPRINLVTGKSLNPVGDLTNKKTQLMLDSIQEHLNNKYGLVSPKDRLRLSDDNYSKVLSRVKGDIFNEDKSDFKQGLVKIIESKGIRSSDEFKSLLSDLGEVKIRNGGSVEQYFSVKLNGEDKFTNLKNPLFSSDYIERRELPLRKPSVVQVKNRLDEWVSKRSLEVKHIYPKSKKIRDEYHSLPDNLKSIYLKEKEYVYDKEHKLNRPDIERKRRWENGCQQGVKRASKWDKSHSRVGLPYLSSSSMVYGIRGSGERSAKSIGVLSSDEQRDLAKQTERGRGEHSDKTLRWNGAGTRRIDDASVVYQVFFDYQENKSKENESKLFSEIKKNIDPNRLLSALSAANGLKIDDYKITKSRDGSPRFRVGSRNMNASDFLTKHLNLSWAEARGILLNVYKEQSLSSNYRMPKVVSDEPMLRDVALERKKSIKESYSWVKNTISSERKELYNSINNMKKELRYLLPDDRDLALGMIVFKKISGLEAINERASQARNFISEYHYEWDERCSMLDSLKKLQGILNKDGENENAIHSEEHQITLKGAIDAQKRLQELCGDSGKLKNLVADKKNNEIQYRDQFTTNVVFKDKGEFLVAGKDVTNEQIGMMLEYAKEKYGGTLKLTGSDDFKERCAMVAAEKGMVIILKPEKYHQMMISHKEEQNKITSDLSSVKELMTIVTNQNKGSSLGDLAQSALKELNGSVPKVELAGDVIASLNNMQVHPALADKIREATNELTSYASIKTTEANVEVKPTEANVEVKPTEVTIDAISTELVKTKELLNIVISQNSNSSLGDLAQSALKEINNDTPTVGLTELLISSLNEMQTHPALADKIRDATNELASYTSTKSAEASTEAKPAEASTEAKPAEASTEAKPAEANTEAKPAEASTEAKPAEASTEAKPAEANTEAKPAEANTEAKPAEANTEAKPAEANTEAKNEEHAKLDLLLDVYEPKYKKDDLEFNREEFKQRLLSEPADMRESIIKSDMLNKQNEQEL